MFASQGSTSAVWPEEGTLLMSPGRASLDLDPFVKNKNASFAVAKPGYIEKHDDTKIGDTSAIRSPPNNF
ncbi:hypothetical protein [Nitrospira sp. Ecomares 2.1]